MSKQPKLMARTFFVGLCGSPDYGAAMWSEDQRQYMPIAYGRTRKEAARRAAAKLRKLAAEFDKIAEGKK